MSRVTSTVRAWAIPPGDRCACGLSCDLSHDSDEATDAQPTRERAPAARPVRQAVSLAELQERVFGDCLWVY